MLKGLFVVPGSNGGPTCGPHRRRVVKAEVITGWSRIQPVGAQAHQGIRRGCARSGPYGLRELPGRRYRGERPGLGDAGVTPSDGRVHGRDGARLSRAGRCEAGAKVVTLRPALEWSVDTGAIDRARVLNGWTRRDLAQHAHVDEGTLCDLFAGRRRPYLRHTPRPLPNTRVIARRHDPFRGPAASYC